jgi:hypothetical protein
MSMSKVLNTYILKGDNMKWFNADAFESNHQLQEQWHELRWKRHTQKRRRNELLEDRIFLCCAGAFILFCIVGAFI